MLAKGAGVFEVAKMLADTVETVEEHYFPVCFGITRQHSGQDG